MKKFFSLMLLLATILVFTACGDDDKDEPNNQFVGKWYAHAKTGSGQWVLDISGDNTLKYYNADDNGQIIGNIRTGSYSTNGTQITFSGVQYYWSSLYTWSFRSGTINGGYLTVSYEGGADAEGQGTVVFQKN